MVKVANDGLLMPIFLGQLAGPPKKGKTEFLAHTRRQNNPQRAGEPNVRRDTCAPAENTVKA